MNILEKKLIPFIESLDKSIEHKSYYTALTTALTLPDICSKLERPNEQNTSIRYSGWFDKYMLKKYTTTIGPDSEERVLLHGKDCYALRCSFLHHGETDIVFQRARERLSNFEFVSTSNNMIIHNNYKDLGDIKVLQLQVDIFCRDISKSVENWIVDNRNDEKINKRAEKLLSIHKINNFFVF